MRAAALGALLLALAAPALAQDARVRSGEHETFSRLVLYLPEAAEYRVENGDGTFAIDFGGDFGFDVADVFRFIPRDRIAEIGGEGGRLELALACECVVTVERLTGSSVYLDVNDPGTVPVEAAATEADVASAADPRPLPAPAIRLPVDGATSTATLLPGGLDLTGGASRAGTAAPAAGPELALETGSPALPAPTLPEPDTSHAVAEQIARAAAQGLLEPDGPVPPARRPEPRPEPARPEPAMPANASIEPGTRRHVSIRTSIDDALGQKVGRSLSDLGVTGPCLPDATFDVAAWMPEEGTGLARLRSHAIGEFDRADPKGVAALAQGYIAMTFGAEARHAMRTFKVPVPDADILLAMAEIVDGAEVGDPGRLATQYDCPNAGALWAALSAPRIPDAAELDTNAVALAFSALPPHMRTHLGPTLAERLIAYGALDTASVVRAAIMRAPGDPSVETRLLDASIALEQGHGDEADAELAGIVEDTSGRSVEAVERLIERRLDAGEPVEDEVLAAADALIYEHRGTPLAFRLSELRIEGLARSGKAREALAFLDETGRHLPDETVERLRGVVYAEGARLLDDAEFLLMAVKAPEFLGHSPEEMAARRAIARRLGGMELHGLADSLGVNDGDLASVAADAAPVPPRPAIRAAMPADAETLERTAALIEHSSALRERLAAALEGQPEAVGTQ